MDSIDSTWNDNDHRDRRKVKLKEDRSYNLYNVDHGKMWEEKFDDKYHIDWAERRAEEHLRDMEETWEKWKELELNDISDVIYERWEEHRIKMFWSENSSDFRGI